MEEYIDSLQWRDNRNYLILCTNLILNFNTFVSN